MAWGLQAEIVEVVVSDGTLGLPAAMTKHLPKAKQQRCITHLVGRLQDDLSYQQLPEHDEMGQQLTHSQAKQQRRYPLQNDAYALYAAPSLTGSTTALGSVFPEVGSSGI